MAIRAFREAMIVGDLALADRALAVLERSDVAPADTVLLRFAQHVATGDWDKAKAAAAEVGRGPLDFVAPVLSAWIALEVGGDPFAPLSVAESNTLARRYAAENRALLLIASGQHQEAVESLKTLLGHDQGSLDLRRSAAMLFAGKGQGKLARALLDGSDPVLASLRASIGRGAKPGAAFGVSRLYARLAADLGRDESSPLAVLLGRSALLLDSDDERTQLLLAETLAKMDAAPRALALVDGVEADGPFGGVARTLRVDILSAMEDVAGATEAARMLAEAPGAGAAHAQSYGDMLVEQQRFDDAAAAYALAMNRAGGRADWIMYLQRGGALEQAGRWGEALPLLKRAVELAPDEPVALNYLGYAQVERGEALGESEKLLERARKLRPDDPSITDSLGWAYVQRGQANRAVPLLEQAAQAEPGDITINEHLGDAYWRVGRRYEARYAWRAAAVHADGDDATRLDAKLARGLGAVTANR